MEYDIKRSWDKALTILESELMSTAFTTWVKPLQPYRVQDDVFLLIAEDKTAKETLERRYMSTIQKALKESTGEPLIPEFVLRSDLDRTDASPARPNSIYSASLRSKYVFETFVKGNCNALALSSALAVAESPGRAYNPLFLYGGVGLGKTHLMHSIGNYILKTNPGSKVLYTSAENLMNEFIGSLRAGKNVEFRTKYRTMDVLLVDDIQFLAEREGTQEEFFHTFNELYNANKQIVISSDKPPIELKTLTSRLTSRFGAGLIVDITMPDFETRMAILEKKAELDHIHLSKDVMTLIAHNISSNIRELEGALNKVTAYAKLTNTEVTIELAERALRDLIDGNTKRDVSVGYIQEIVANHYGVSPEDLVSKKRTANITSVRHMAMYLSRMILSEPLTKIGQAFGGRDHSTVIHAYDKVSEELESNEETRLTVIMLEKMIKGDM